MDVKSGRPSGIPSGMTEILTTGSENRLRIGKYEAETARRLLTERFDGTVIIDAKSGLLVKTDPWLTGKLGSFASFTDVPYDTQMCAAIEAIAPPEDREKLMKATSLSHVCERISASEQKTYSIDFFVLLGKARKRCYEHLTYSHIYKNDADSPIILTCEDISSIIASEIDPITGLYTVSGFHRRVKEWIESHPGRKYRIQRYNIDRFRDINGIHGYAVGNRLLCDFGTHMKMYDTESSFSAHLNADHFVRFCSEDSRSVNEYYEIFESIFAKYDLKIPITIHMGIYDLCEPDCDSYTMSYKALLALQSIKGSLVRRIAYYEKGMMDFEKEQQELLVGVERAVENEEFEIWFQPQVDYQNGVMTGAEALIRWRHPTMGLLSPTYFIPLLEKSDCIGAVDEYMFAKACAFARRRLDRHPENPVRVSVNLSRKDIYMRDLCGRLKDIAESCKLPPNCIHIELTESAYTENAELLAAAAGSLREAGFIIEMDDFGSGYSSLNILKDIDIDILKLDMKFLSGSPENRKSEIIISSVINMANKLNIPVLAEGVETKEQADMLLSFGCRYMQGYYFSKPLPEAEYEKLLDGGGLFV